MILQLAEKHNRTVSIVGRSMLNLIAHARNLNYIKCDDNLLKPLHMVRNLPDENILILTTGSQGEHMAALSRIARKEHPHINIREGDTVVFSANPIPGNTIAVVNTIDKLMMQGAKVIYGRNQGVHVSGHGCQEDQKLMIALTRPKFFLPVHGEHRMLVKHSETAQSMGIPRENIVIIDNGNIVELAEESIKVLGKVPSGIELVDTSSSGMVSAKVLQERQVMANEGIVTIATAIDWSGKLLAKPEIHLRGVVTCIEKSLLQKLVQQRIEESLSLHWQELSHCVDNGDSEVDWSGLEGILERELIRFLKRELQCQPNVTLLIQIPEAPAAKVTDGRRRRTRTTAQVAS
jgi:ribonuclease J